MRIALFFGSFNPIHIGHLAIANYTVAETMTEQVWFVVSPHNPFKNKANLLPEYQRLELVNRSIANDDRFRASQIEFTMPMPSYTIDTVIRLQEKYPHATFSILMGSDQLPSFHQWKNPEQLVQLVNFMVYPRPGFNEIPSSGLTSQFHWMDAPLMDISSSYIRKAIKKGLDVRHFMHHKAWEFLSEMSFYKR